MNLFITYRRSSEKWGKSISRELIPAGYLVSTICIDTGQEWWTDNARTVVDSCDVVLCELIEDIQHEHFLDYALKTHKTLFCLQLSPQERPAYQPCLSFIDFSASYEVGMQELKAKLAWLGSPRFKMTREKVLRLSEEVAPLSREQLRQETLRATDLARYLRDRVDVLKITAETVAMGVGIEEDFIEALIEGTFPVDELDKALLEEIAATVECSMEDLFAIIGRKSE